MNARIRDNNTKMMPCHKELTHSCMDGKNCRFSHDPAIIDKHVQEQSKIINSWKLSRASAKPPDSYRQSTPGTGNSNNYRGSTPTSIQNRTLPSMRNFPKMDDIEEKVGIGNNNKINSHIRFDEISPETPQRLWTDGSRGGGQGM